jgi:quinoprotein glucose dehydrogenase
MSRIAFATRAARLAIFALTLVSATLGSQPDNRYRAWAAYGGNPEQMRYSRLDQINRKNVADLQVAWTWDSGEAGGLQTQPIVVDDWLFANTPSHKVVALDATTGALRWTFDAKIQARGPNRGVTYWAEGSDRRVFAAVDQFVYALNARTGQPITTFGSGGRIDLRENLGRDPRTQNVALTTPGVAYRDMIIIGGRVSEGLPASPGAIRAFDTRSGQLRWTFHTIPHPGEFGYETWPKDAWTYSGGANNWAGMALDERRGIVYVPTGSAAADFYGANRIGDNLFANSLIALDAATGKRIWHYQVVRHDIWDRDFPSPPSLVTLQRAGRAIDAVVQTTKHGWVFVFDRTNGTPLFPIEERSFPASTVPGEVTARTQPLPTLPRPFARQLLTADLLTTRTAEAHAWALAQFKTFRSEGQFIPFSVGRDTVVFPGFDGGAEWGGAAVDPESALFYVNANDLAWTGGLAPSEAGQGGRDTSAATNASPTRLPYRFTGYRRFLDPEGYPAVAPPWGTLSAINLNTGEYAWQIPLGEYPELVEKGWRNTGSENYGGPIVTAGGLVFIGATNNDKKFRAFDKATGQLLWETILPYAGNATPATYEINGRQFVVIAAGGGKARGAPSGGTYVAFSLK